MFQLGGEQLDLEHLGNVPTFVVHEASTRRGYLQTGYKRPSFPKETHAGNHRTRREANTLGQHCVARISLHKVLVSNSTRLTATWNSETFEDQNNLKRAHFLNSFEPIT